MKISQMIEREDFYEINEKTLAGYFSQEETGKTELFIYPRLNAIVTAKPSKRVINYLLCEYSVRGNTLKRLGVRCYVHVCLQSFGILAAKKSFVYANVGSDLLIYPCNKKYRIFDFKNQTVDVIAKKGFDDFDLQHEMVFRKQIDLPEFVPGFISSNENGYREAIIYGRPLARITDGFEDFREQAYNLLLKYGENQQKKIAANIYANMLVAEIQTLLKQKADNIAAVQSIVKALISMIDDNDNVILTFSHGDFQAGNIWVENKTNKIYIIDWESWGIRSTWYDRATLYQGLRPGAIEKYLSVNVSFTEKAIVLLEDVIFHLHELNSLPMNFGVDQFRQYCEALTSWVKTGVQNE